jgi:Na+/H+-dicarboxylate symporter
VTLQATRLVEDARRVPLWLQVLIGVVVGAVVGAVFRDRPWLFGYANADLGPLGLLVVRLLKALATPLVFVAIVDSFLKTSLSARSGARLLLICALNVSVAMALGLALLDTFQPGTRWAGRLEDLGLLVGAGGPARAPAATLDPLQNLAGFVPESVVEPFAKNLVISIVLLAILTGATLRELRDRATAELAPAMTTVAHLVDVGGQLLTAMLLKVANLMPYAVAFIVADVVGKAGLAVFGALWIFLAAMLAGLLIHALVYYPLLAFAAGGVTPWRFLRGGLDAVVTAVSCNSSLATMPVTLRCLQGLGVRESSARLSVCVGTNFNNDGIMLYEAMATLFLCQAMGLDLSFGEQLTVVLASIMAGVGIAGIPEAGLIILPLVLGAAGLSEAAVAVAIPLIVPVDWIIARVRSGVNVLADMVVAVVLDRFEEDRGPAARQVT